MSGAFAIDDLKEVVFLGAAPQLSAMIDIVQKMGMRTTIWTSPDQVAQLPESMEHTVFEALDDKFFNHVDSQCDVKSMLFVSLGARWIFSRKVIDCLGGHLVNFHGARLPFDAGGGGFSWRIMNRDRIDMQLVHLVDEGVDTGAILMHDKAVLPASLRTPQALEDYSRQRTVVFFEKFLRAVTEGVAITPTIQVDYIGRYYPRLMTNLNGWIDWSWSGADIETFITAFDVPYPGARTLWNGKPVRLKSVQLHGGEPGGHPFTSGLVARHDGEWLIVSTGGEFSLIVQTVLDEDGNDLLPRIRAGDRFHSAPADLAQAISERARFGPKGAKTSVGS